MDECINENEWMNDVCMYGHCLLTVGMLHNFHYTMHGRQITYPLICDTQHKQLPQQLFKINYLKFLTKTGAEMKCKQTSGLRRDLNQCHAASF
jgi:hypothetical protein